MFLGLWLVGIRVECLPKLHFPHALGLHAYCVLLQKSLLCMHCSPRSTSRDGGIPRAQNAFILALIQTPQTVEGFNAAASARRPHNALFSEPADAPAFWRNNRALAQDRAWPRSPFSKLRSLLDVWAQEMRISVACGLLGSWSLTVWGLSCHNTLKVHAWLLTRKLHFPRLRDSVDSACRKRHSPDDGETTALPSD